MTEISEYHRLKDAHVAEFERAYLLRALEETAGNVNQAAKLAGVNGANFRRLMRKHQVTAASFRNEKANYFANKCREIRRNDEFR